MRRREFVLALISAAFIPLVAEAREANSYRVAFLTTVGDEDASAVKTRLNELGYSEGKNLIFDFRSAEGRLSRLPQLAADIVATRPDVIITGFGTVAAQTAQNSSSSSISKLPRTLMLSFRRRSSPLQTR
jgi:putative ABC transport system substrate-binding protein